MAISDRIQGTIENWSRLWGERLKGWIKVVIGLGIESFFDVLGKSGATTMTPLLDMLDKTGGIPPEVQKVLNDLRSPKGEFAAMLAQSAGSAVVGGALGRILDGILLPLAYAVNMSTKLVKPDIGALIEANKRGIYDDAPFTVDMHTNGLADRYIELLREISKPLLSADNVVRLDMRAPDGHETAKQDFEKQGWSDDQVKAIRELMRQLLDPQTVTRLWLRDKDKYEKFWRHVEGQGYDADTIAALKELSNIIPPVQDIITMAVREAFSPDVASQFGQYEDYPEAIDEWLEKGGLSKEWGQRYWAAHWALPSATQGYEMLHRGVIDEDTLKVLLRALDVMPFWREKLIEMSWNIPTRVDIRRFWELRTIDEARLKEYYTRLGYHGKDLDDYIVWTKVYTDFPTWLARYKNGWVSLEEVAAWLASVGVSPEQANVMLQEKVKTEQEARVAPERDLTKAEIVKGVKKGILSHEQGVTMLYNMGYSMDESEYILTINVEAQGSPETPLDYLDIVNKYKVSQGKQPVVVPTMVRDIDKALLSAKRELDNAKTGKRPQDEITRLEAVYLEYKARYDEAVKSYRLGI